MAADNRFIMSYSNRAEPDAEASGSWVDDQKSLWNLMP
jgi:hypothetical protein